MKEHKVQLDGILSHLNQIYQQLDGFYNSTLEMDKLADGEDPTAFGVYVDMRENNITRISHVNEQLKQDVEKLPPALASQVREALMENKGMHFADADIAAIRDADKRNRELHARTVELDKALGHKIGATQSVASVPQEEEKPE